MVIQDSGFGRKGKTQEKNDKAQTLRCDFEDSLVACQTLLEFSKIASAVFLLARAAL
jgi:hypothetical protein